ncbi:hypothetical protein HH214_00010 [Mucilaginibacter robiniae]|uniref:RiboL-PSP-HEPN domain-containing protein n=1 Tax=Mucilaginibacter robiniae TaxID=2728022 RepID=A0A7L5DWC7_9SPHI|nr:MAE_28990/MAE_18760 family HEPN-like nuclease [Mucilaginibacter robiniae]QJD94367.1 hypothetical protein HH214_00010 [Mucilaginibacter robiniae]
MKLRLDQQEKKLDELFNMVQAVSDEEIKAYLSKFLCIRTSGLLENALKGLLLEFVHGSSPQQVENYIGKSIRSLTNLKDEKIEYCLKSFSDEWHAKFCAKISEEQRSALNSVVTNRNNIAHGEVDNLTFKMMEGYYFKVKEVIQLLKIIIKK